MPCHRPEEPDDLIAVADGHEAGRPGSDLPVVSERRVPDRLQRQVLDEVRDSQETAIVSSARPAPKARPAVSGPPGSRHPRRGRVVTPSTSPHRYCTGEQSPDSGRLASSACPCLEPDGVVTLEVCRLHARSDELWSWPTAGTTFPGMPTGRLRRRSVYATEQLSRHARCEREVQSVGLVWQRSPSGTRTIPPRRSSCTGAGATWPWCRAPTAPALTKTADEPRERGLRMACGND